MTSEDADSKEQRHTSSYNVKRTRSKKTKKQRERDKHKHKQETYIEKHYLELKNDGNTHFHKTEETGARER